MSENLDNFSKWFKNPLSRLHKNTDAGFIILIVSLPLLERYLREKTGNFENPTLDDKFYDEFVNLFPRSETPKPHGNFGKSIATGCCIKPR